MTTSTGGYGAHKRRFHVLVVCTANQFRSPLAELMLRSAASKAGLDWEFTSAGTRAQPGQPLLPAIAAMFDGAVTLDGDWRSRAMDRPAIEQADLVLTAEAEHRSAVVKLAPPAVKRTFLIKQFARLIAAASQPVDYFSEDVVDEAVRMRGRVRPVDRRLDEIADPAGRNSRALQSCVTEIAAATETILSVAPKFVPLSM